MDGTRSGQTGDHHVVDDLTDHLRNLLQGDHHVVDLSQCSYSARKISDEDGNCLAKLPSEEEIKEAIQAMNPRGAPGPDGFTGQFYLDAWDIIRSDLIVTIQCFFRGGTLPRAASHTHIILIPKKEKPTKFEDLRPISLCNFFPKIISKIIASRIAPFLEEIISSEQSAFIRGRLIRENIAFAQEMCADLDRKNKDGMRLLSLLSKNPKTPISL